MLGIKTGCWLLRPFTIASIGMWANKPDSKLWRRLIARTEGRITICSIYVCVLSARLWMPWVWFSGLFILYHHLKWTENGMNFFLMSFFFNLLSLWVICFPDTLCSLQCVTTLFFLLKMGFNEEDYMRVEGRGHLHKNQK